MRSIVRLTLVTAGCLVASSLVLNSAAADHTPLPETVTVVGSLQSELDCPGDWLPECEATQMQPVDGSPGVFEATFDVPAGSYEYKVAIDGSWDVNYGAGGALNGSNIVLEVPAGASSVTFEWNQETHVVTHTINE